MTLYPANIHHRNYGCRLREFVLNHYRAITLENETIRVTILLDKGTDIYEFLYKPKDIDFLWKSSLGLRSMKDGHGGDFLDFYEGGWQELFPWGGHTSEYRGVTTGLHGEVALEPWHCHIEVDTPDQVKITCSIRTRKAPFLLAKTFTLNRYRAVLEIEEAAFNESIQEMKFVWGHHPAYGWPFLDESCVIDLPPCQVMTLDAADETSRLKENIESTWPWSQLRDGRGVDLSRIPAPDARCQDLAYMHNFTEGWYALRNRTREVGIGLAWDAKVFPWIWYWQCFRGGPDYPFWGAEYVAAIEPVTSRAVRFSDAVENGTARSIAGGETLRSRMSVWAFESSRAVTRISNDGVEFESPKIAVDSK